MSLNIFFNSSVALLAAAFWSSLAPTADPACIAPRNSNDLDLNLLIELGMSCCNFSVLSIICFCTLIKYLSNVWPKYSACVLK